ncbi:hypothetical protein I7I53_01479 [Histoplasma capsulatum var. duboisii H88]|uniref:Uncharacterized protein n=1 Tax=Ajellomyces capsulatus (strain H88) TaxID=544711 RepID=A0A8A1LI25_AJEC8|nr:hypothetical protein I7I53_01479 [Histoplasma capsulatum var. duboisii H88]
MMHALYIKKYYHISHLYLIVDGIFHGCLVDGSLCFLLFHYLLIVFPSINVS